MMYYKNEKLNWPTVTLVTGLFLRLMVHLFHGLEVDIRVRNSNEFDKIVDSYNRLCELVNQFINNVTNLGKNI